MNPTIMYFIAGAGVLNLILMLLRGVKTKDNVLALSGIINIGLVGTALLFAIRPDLYDMNTFHTAVLTVIGVSAIKEVVYLASHRYQNIIDAAKLAQALKNLGDKYALVFETSLVGFYVINAEGTIELVNEKFCAIMGYTKQELIGKSIYSLIAPEYVNVAEHNVQLRLSGQYETMCYDLNAITKGNQIIPVKVYSSRTQNGHTTITGCILQLSDIRGC
jgi:PAS domain S-box-containing protein